MDADFLGSALHIVLGSSAGGIMRQVLRPYRGQLLIGEDQLAWGPAPATDDLDIWQGVREWSLNRVARTIGLEFSFDSYSDDGLLMNAGHLGAGNEIAVWIGTGLPDQLNLAWTVFLCEGYGVDLAKLRVIQFERHKSRLIRAMDQVHPDTIRDHYPPPRALTDVELDELRRAWRVYTSADPADLADYAAGTSPLPFLHEALSALLLRYPDRKSGLGALDETLLRDVKRHGPKAARIVAGTMAGNDGPDRQNHDYLFWRLLRMGKLEAPLVTVGGRPTADFGIEFLKRAYAPRMLTEGEITLTPLGEAVLAGEANAVHENGIDDWIGGVHLTDEQRPPFREGRTLLLE